MHILDQTSDNSLSNVVLHLTPSEALELRDSINDLLQKPSNNHAHISNDNFQKEITICIYDKAHEDGFDEKSKPLITDPINEYA